MLEHILITIGPIAVSLVGLAIFPRLRRKSSEGEVIAEYHFVSEGDASDVSVQEAEIEQRVWRRAYAR